MADLRPCPPAEIAPCPVRRHEPPEVAARFHFLTPGRVVGFARGRGVVLRQYRSKGQKSPMITALRLGGGITESPASTVTEVSDRVLDCVDAPVYPWCTPESVEELLHHLEELPGRLPELPILIPKDDEPIPDAIVQTLGDFCLSNLSFAFRLSEGLSPRLQTSAGTASTRQIDPGS